jgi:heme/copper-type cytochrome/quinol oxidase subunit 3
MRDSLGGIVLSALSGPPYILTFLAIMVASLLLFAVAFVRFAAAKAKNTYHPSDQARRRLRLWAVVAIGSAALSLGAATVVVAKYILCLGEC